MIYAIDHLQACTPDLAGASKVMSTLGWRKEFEACGLPNPPEKRPFTHSWRPYHDIALYKRHGVPPIEYVAPFHGHTSSRQYIRDDAEYVVPGSKPHESREWWCEAFGFERTNGHVCFTPHAGESLWLRFIESDDRPWVLDGRGYTCIGLRTTDIEADLECAKDGASRASDPFSLTVNGRGLSIAIVAGPGGELVELIEVER